MALLATGLAQAQYKVVGPDGKVTYTDRPPVAADSKAAPLAGRAAPVSNEVALPLALRQAVSRFPVTLYVTTGACAPCDSGREMLRQRGVPFSEKQIVRAEDSDALERLTGARDAPTLTLGAQTVRGWSSELWASYLDAAGYPRDSRLPANYEYPPASPLTVAREASRPAGSPVQQAARAEPAPAAPVVPPPTPGGIRF
ncbi:MAG: glutaredoxin family protein [Rhizobacter sp.]|nr:glutaredoxin family protein [Rhizobacter sp.]